MAVKHKACGNKLKELEGRGSPVFLCEVCKEYLVVEDDHLLWQATYRKHPNSGAVDGFSVKLSGSIVEAAERAEQIGIENKAVLQMLRRRY
jgi:hypothetical protein